MLDFEQEMARKVSGIKSSLADFGTLRESPFPGVHRDGGTSAGLFDSQLHLAASDLCKKWGSGGFGNWWEGSGNKRKENGEKK